MSFITESISSGFGVDGVEIKQTLSSSYDAFSGLDLNTNSFQNTLSSLINFDNDKRESLGMFFFNEDNISQDSFPDVLSFPFIGLNKPNLVNNGNCKFTNNFLLSDVVVEPQGKWHYMGLRGQYNVPSSQDRFNSNFIQHNNGQGTPDSQGFLGYGGFFQYIPIQGEIDSYYDDMDNTRNFRKHFLFLTNGNDKITQEDFNSHLTGEQPIPDTTPGSIASVRSLLTVLYNENLSLKYPTIASWIQTDEAYSYDRCLCFINYEIWNANHILDLITNGDTSTKYIFNTLLPYGYATNSKLDDAYSTSDVEYFTENQYRVLNQVQKIYDKFNDDVINPYTSFKVRFKMKTTHVLPPSNYFTDANEKQLFIENPLNEELEMAPQVEVGILTNQAHETPFPGVNNIWTEQNSYSDVIGRRDIYFDAKGFFNSDRYSDANTFANKKFSNFGGMGRFQNSVINEWETFEFNFNLTEEHNNRGMIYGVRYGGVFDDEKNGGPVEIQLNTIFTDAQPGQNLGEIHFKVRNASIEGTLPNGEPADRFYITDPGGLSRVVAHEPFSTDENGDATNTIASGLGDEDNVEQATSDTLEAYIMYVGQIAQAEGISMEVDNYDIPDLVVAYWDGERWSYDNNRGYDSSRQFNPDETCFIIARLYSDEAGASGITSMEQYISNENAYPTDGVGNLYLFLQSGNNFNGRVLIDDIECYESYEFYPDVDVRKKISNGVYGSGDLTNYYDKELQNNEYKDSTAPLEAQFYFYPQYPTNEILDVERTPIYSDFRSGLFYIYDVDWGDGTPNEFSTPEQIDEQKAIYHTYETNGVFEVTGTMLRVKVDENNNILGVAHNKKFKLRININEGLDEEFQYFGSDGYSFIPYKNTTPIIGGISKQSSYYKKIKRQLGFIGNEKINITFKNNSDKLKTELALLKMDSEEQDKFEILPSYLENRFLSPNGELINDGISVNKQELGKSIGDCDLANIKFYNTGSLSIHQLLGFEDEQSNIPDNPRYWKNIISENDSILDRQGIDLQSNPSIDVHSEQDWLGDYYYPVLPKYGANGRFVNIEMDEDNNVISGYPSIDGVLKIPFPLEGPITDENESNENLIIHIINDKVETDVLQDKSGNENKGFAIKDFSPKFENETLRVRKSKITSVIKTSTNNGAF